MKISWNDSMPVWWSLVWRGFIYGAVGGALLGFVAGAIAGGTGHLDKAATAGAIAGWLAGLAGSMLALKQALQVHLSRLALLCRSESVS
jgi:hypothetical protein